MGCRRGPGPSWSRQPQPVVAPEAVDAAGQEAPDPVRQKQVSQRLAKSDKLGDVELAGVEPHDNDVSSSASGSATVWTTV